MYLLFLTIKLFIYYYFKTCLLLYPFYDKGGGPFFFVGMLKTFFFASLCSFICLQAVYQLSGPED